jgi:hypothetical protein
MASGSGNILPQHPSRGKDIRDPAICSDLVTKSDSFWGVPVFVAYYKPTLGGGHKAEILARSLPHRTIIWIQHYLQ